MYDARIVDAAIAERRLPKPCGHQILIALPSVKEKTEGGVILPDEHVDRENLAAICGYVLAIGPDAYVTTEEKAFPGGAYCKIGDWVMFRMYAGTRFSITQSGVTQKFSLINDDSVQAVVADPTSIVRR